MKDMTTYYEVTIESPNESIKITETTLQKLAENQ